MSATLYCLETNLEEEMYVHVQPEANFKETLLSHGWLNILIQHTRCGKLNLL